MEQPAAHVRAPGGDPASVTIGSQRERPHVLVVDDEETVAHVLHDVLTDQGCVVSTAHSAEQGLALLRETPPHAALVDIILPGMNGLELLAAIKRESPDTEVLIMTSQASVESAVRAIREGAYDYLEKPFEDLDQIWMTVTRALEKRSLALANRQLLADEERHNRELSAAVLRLTSFIDAGRAMAEFESLSGLLDFFLGLVARELGVDRASLMLTDESTGELRIAAHRGIDDFPVQDVRVPRGRGIAGRVAQSGEAFLVTDTRSDPRIEAPPKSDLSNSFISAPIVLSIPIKAQEKVLGVINVTNRRSGEPFAPQDLEYLAGLAGQAAVAIERTAHLEKLQDAYRSLKDAQEQLLRSERLKALGEMAAGVAHDFNNALTVILGRVHVALTRLQLDPGGAVGQVRLDLETVRKITLQAADTIRRIQDYTRIRKDAPDAAVDLNALVRETVEITRPKWKDSPEVRGGRVEVRLDLGDAPPISGSASELSQVLGNLVFNAVEAMPQGGALTLRTAHRDGRVVLEVSDTGTGMSETTRDHLFEPFYTTKENGQGLGMSIVYGIVTRHHGEIAVSSTPGAGTTFTLSFPVRASVQGPVLEGPQPEQAKSDGVRVLLVDDDDSVRAVHEEMLVLHGHRVVSVPSGQDALDRLEHASFDVVVTDLGMAGLSGIELTRKIKQRDPRLPVVLLSGWAVQQDSEQVSQAGVDCVLAKPCGADELLRTVQTAISPPGKK